ncbi:MAG: AI-2E family transporter, partial [Alphaproteobacteria bacterium]|nr:AI-2E family transporter [Alphaproteobacteria bacterium]
MSETPGLRLFQYAAVFGIAALSVVLLVEARPLLIPFAVAIMIWFLIDALRRGFSRVDVQGRGLPDWLALTLAVLVVLGALAFVVDLVSQNVQAVARTAPTYQQNLERVIGQAFALFGIEEDPSIRQMLEDVKFGPLIGDVASTLASIAGNAGIVLIYLLFLLLEQGSFSRKVDALVTDEKRRRNVHRVMSEIGRDIRSYIWIKTLMSLFTGGASYIVLLSVGVDYASFWGFIIFLLNSIPTIGSLLGIIFPSLLTLVQFDTLGPFLIVTPILAALQIFIGNVVEPRVMGRSLNLSALVVILSLTVWGSIWGVA